MVNALMVNGGLARVELAGFDEKLLQKGLFSVRENWVKYKSRFDINLGGLHATAILLRQINVLRGFFLRPPHIGLYAPEKSAAGCSLKRWQYANYRRFLASTNGKLGAPAAVGKTIPQIDIRANAS
jgi:hypothetical protein